jgi:hypothetical protein
MFTIVHYACYLQDYYDYLQSLVHPGPDLMCYVQDLPSSLCNAVATSLYKPAVSQIPLFLGVKPAFLERLTRGLNLAVYLKGT